MQLREIERDGEPQPGAAEAAGRPALELTEPLEHRLALLRRHARPRVGHLDRGTGCRGVRPQRAAHPSAGRSELERVGEEVEQHALQLVGIGLGRQVVRRLERDGDVALGGERIEMGRHPAHQLCQVDVGIRETRLARLELRGVEQVVDVLQQQPRVLHHAPQITRRGLGQRPGAEQPLGGPEDQGERRAQLVAHVGEELALQRVQLLQPPARLGDLLRALVDLRLHLRRFPLERRALLLHAHELGDVFHAVDDVGEAAVGRGDRCVDGTPEALLEAAALRLGAADVVALHRHRVGDAVAPHPLERRLEVAHPFGGGIVGVVGEYVEDEAPHDRGALGHRGREIRVAHRDDGEVGTEDEIEAGGRLEEGAEVGHG